MGLVQRDGINRLRHVMKYSRQDETICSRLSSDGWWAESAHNVGAPDPREMAKADLIVVWGCNPASTQVNVMTHIAKARKTRTRRWWWSIPTRRGPPRSPTITWLCGRVLTARSPAASCTCSLRKTFADRDYLARYTDCPDEFEGPSREPRSRVGLHHHRHSGVRNRRARPHDRPHQAHLYPPWATGFTRSRNGAANMHAATSIAAVTGAWQYEGGGAMHTNKSVYGVDATLIEGLDARDRSVRLLDMSRIGPVLTGDPDDLGDGPPVTAIVMQNVNPATVAPESAKVRDGLMREDLFLAVHEQFIDRQPRAMPTSCCRRRPSLEHDDIYVGGGHSYLLMGAKVIEPLCRDALQPRRDPRARQAARRRASGLRHDRVGADRRDAEALRPPRCGDAQGRALERLHAGLRDRPSPERLRLAGRAVSASSRTGPG